MRRYERMTGVQVTGAKAVIARAADGDLRAKAIWSDALDALAVSIAQLAAVLAPEAIVIGGGLPGIADIGLSDLAAAHGRWRHSDTRRLGNDRLEVYEPRRPQADHERRVCSPA